MGDASLACGDWPRREKPGDSWEEEVWIRPVPAPPPCFMNWGSLVTVPRRYFGEPCSALVTVPSRYFGEPCSALLLSLLPSCPCWQIICFTALPWQAN